MRLTISCILVPMDFSGHSEFALRYATALASRVGASVELLHVVEDPIASVVWGSETVLPDVTELRTELVADAERRLLELRDTVEGQRVPVRTTVRIGPAAHTILEYAQAAGIDLIVMGTHGRTGVAHLFMGSVAERVLRHSHCPVLTVRDAGRAEQPREQIARGVAV